MATRKTSSSLLSNLALLYDSYGGLHRALLSAYTAVSVVVTGLVWRLAFENEWCGYSISILPTLAGFTIAAYALLFSVLSDKSRQALSAPAPELNNRSPLLTLAGSITHAVVVQIMGLLIALVFLAKPFPRLPNMDWLADGVNVVTAFGGLFFLVYGILLVVASALTVFRLLAIVAKIDGRPVG